VEADAFGQFWGDRNERLALPDHVKLGANLAALDPLIDAKGATAIIPETGEYVLCIGYLVRLGRICPENNRSVADLDAVAAVAAEITVKHGGIGCRGHLRDRCIFTLLVAVGFVGLRVERHD
jgi:hypothetical protein